MSRRRINSAKRLSRSRRSSDEPGELDDDSNVFSTDDPNWYKRIEANNTKLLPSLQLSYGGETTGVLDSESDVETISMGPPPANWWKVLSKFDQSVQQTSDVEKTIHSTINTKPNEEDGNATEESLDSEPDKNLRNRKKRLYLGSQTRESPRDNAFLNVLNDSAITVISDPGPSKRRKSMSKMSFLSDEDSLKKTNNSRHSGHNKTDDETSKVIVSNTRKFRPTFFKKVEKSKTESTDNIFKNILDNISSSTNSTIASINENQPSVQTSINAHKSDLQDLEGTKSEQEQNAALGQKRKSRDFEQYHNTEQNLNQNQRATRSQSKTSDISMSSNSKAKIPLPENEENNTTFESNFSDIAMRKKRPGLFRANRKSIAANAFENILTSEEDSTLIKSPGKNSSTISLHKEKEHRVENQSKTNPNSNLTSIVEANYPESRLRMRDDTDSEMEIDVENKNEGARTIKEDSLKSMSKRKRKSDSASQIVSENRLKNTTNKLVGSEEEEDLISIGSQRIDEQSKSKSAFNTSKNKNSSHHKTKNTLQNIEYSKQSSQFNKSVNDEKQAALSRLSIFNEQPQYESTRKIDLRETRKSVRKSESISGSKLSNMKGNEDYSKRLGRTEEELIGELTAGVPTTLNRSKEMPDKNVNQEEELDSDIEVFDPKVVRRDKNESNISNLQQRDKTKSNNVIEISEHNSGNIANSPTQSSQKEGTGSSERSHTISLSEGQSVENEMLGEISTPTESSRTSNQQSNTNFNGNDKSLKNGNEEPVQHDTSLKKQSAKPTITKYEVLTSNNIDLIKLKENKAVVQPETGVENIPNAEKNNLSSLSKSGIREISALTSFHQSKIFTKDTRILTIEEEFSRLHAEDNLETPLTSHGESSQNIILQDFNDEQFKDDSKNKSTISDIRKTLEYDDESEISENPMLTYMRTTAEVESNDERENSTQTKQPKDPSPIESDVKVRKKITNDFFKHKILSTATEKSLSINPSQPITQEQLREAKQKIEAITAKVKEEFSKPQSQESTTKKVTIIKKPAIKKKTNHKPTDPAYMINGVVYKQPKLPRPASWATDRLYKYIWKKIEPKYQIATRVRSEKFMLILGEVVKKVTRRSVYKNYEKDLENLMREMARLGIIVNRKDFNDFCIEFLPYSFRVKATPILLPGNKMSIPYDPNKLYTPLI